MTERINGLRYRIGPRTFFQTNPACCERLYAEIVRRIPADAGRTLDLYCGCGGITLQAASRVKEIVGVDNVPQNIGQAVENARLNGILNATFICSDAEALIRQAVQTDRHGRFQTIIVDPPRAGLTRKARHLLLDSGARTIIYVSCNPLNLAEDLKALSGPYTVESLTGVDMFPSTRHMEVVALLTRGDSPDATPVPGSA